MKPQATDATRKIDRELAERIEPIEVRTARAAANIKRLRAESSDYRRRREEKKKEADELREENRQARKT